MQYVSIPSLNGQECPTVGSSNHASLAAKLLQHRLPWKLMSLPMLRHVETGLMDIRGDSETREE